MSASKKPYYTIRSSSTHGHGAFAARKIARRPADKNMTFGYGRAEVVAALINYTVLIAIAFYLAAEGVNRLLDPPQVQGWLVVVVASIALIVDAVTALLIFRMSKPQHQWRKRS